MATQTKDTEDTDAKAAKAQATKEATAKAQETAKKAAADKAPEDEAPAVEPPIPGGPQTADPSTRSVSTEAQEEEKSLSEVVEQDAAVFEDRKVPQTNPSHFVETYGEHEETGKEQALRHAGDGTLSVWPAQPATAKSVTLGADGKPVEAEAEATKG